MVETVDFGSRKWKWELRKAKMKQGAINLANGVRRNSDVIIMLAPTMALGIKGVTKITSKAIQHHTVKKEIDFKQRTIYDHSLGRYVELKRKLTPAQALTIEERRASGEKLHMILNDMGLLKK